MEYVVQSRIQSALGLSSSAWSTISECVWMVALIGLVGFLTYEWRKHHMSWKKFRTELMGGDYDV